MWCGGKKKKRAERKGFPMPATCSVGTLDEFLSDGNASFLRAARAGNLEKIIECLKGNIDINTCNANGLNALHLAAKEGHVHVVTELLRKGANVNSATKKGNTALHIASLAGQEEVVRVLVNLGANINVQSQNGFTPLYMAAQENHDTVVSFLLANGANQGLATEDGFTPLAVALQQGHDRVVAVLLENDTKGRVRLPALHIAAKKDDCKAASLLLQSDHNPDITSKSGFTPLHIAAHYGNENVANILLSKGADVNYSAKHQITPLHVASKWGKRNMVSLLLEKGANIESATRDGLTPLHCAARSGHDQVVNLLLEKEAPFLAKTKNGLAPLHMASQGDHVDSARNLLHHKVPVDDVTVDYLTALHVAAHCGHVKVAKLLLDRKADPNARALNGFTPLHIACKKNRIKVVELLLKHGASIEATTESGLTPLHVASFMGCMNIVIYLIQNGANPDVPTVRGETPLHLAARANQTDIIRILLRNGASVDARAREEQTPLHIAARLGNADIVSLLLQHGAAVDATTKDLYTALHIAAKEDQEEVASYLLDHGASLISTTKKGFTPLHLAAKYGNIKVARLLLQKSTPIDAQGKNGVTSLHVAAHYDHVNIALLLLDKGASPHAVAKNGYTPLHIAAKKNQIDIASSLLEYRAKANAESKAGFIPLHLSAQEGHADMSSLLIEHKSGVNHKANNGLTPLHLCAQEDRVNVASILVKSGAEVCPQTKAGYTPLHVASHFGQMNMVRFLLQHGANVHTTTAHGYTSLHQAAQQGHSPVVNLLLENQASPNATTTQGQTPLSIAQRLGYISVVETLKVVTETTVTTTTTTITEEKYKVVAPETMQEAFMTDSEDEGGEETMLGDQSYRYLTADEMKSLGDDSLPIDVTKDEKQLEKALHSIRQFGAPMVEDDTLSPQHVIPVESGFSEKFSPDNVDLTRAPVHAGSFSWEDDFYYSYPPKAMLRSSRLKWKTFLVSFMVDARGGAMRGCRHSGVRVIIPPRKASMPMRITCRYLRKEKLAHPPPLMEGEACASRILEMGPVGAKFLGPVILEIPHFASSRGKEREITILRSDCGENWKEHTLEASEEAVQDVLNESFEGEELSALEDLNTNRITRILTTDFPQYFAIISRVRQEVHGVGPEGGMLSSTVVPQVQAIFPEGALTKKIRVGLQAQPIAPELVAKLLGNRVAVSPIVTVEPRRRKFHKPITLTIPVPQAATKGMINQYSGDAPTLRLLCSITGSTKSGGSSKAQWEDVTGSTPLTFVNDCVSFTTTVSARFWLMDCRQLSEVSRYATELYQEAVYVPFMSKFVIFAKRHDPYEAQLRVFCMTDDKEDKTLETQEHFVEVAKSRDVEVLEGKMQYLEFAGNLIPVTNSGDQLKLSFQAFHENRLPFTIRVKDPHIEPMGRIAFMREPKVGRGEPPQVPICNLNVALPDALFSESSSDVLELVTLEKKYDFMQAAGLSKPELIHRADLRLSDIARELDKDWEVLARQLEVSDADIDRIRTEASGEYPVQAIVMLRLWLQKAGSKATGNELEKGLRKINREDIIKTCMFNVELVTDDVEKAVAKVHLDQSGFDVFKEELGSSREASMRRGASLDASYDEQDIMKEAESAAETSSETGSLFERDQIYQALPDDRDARIRRASKTPPPSPVDFSGKDDIEEKFKEVSFTQLYPDTKEVIVKKYATETRSGEISTGVGGLFPSAGQEVTARLTESETWPSGELDTSQVSLSSLPDDEKSEPTTATISGVAAAEENAEFDDHGEIIHIQKQIIQEKISTTEKEEIDTNEPCQSAEIKDVSDVIALPKSLPESEIVDSYEKHEPVENNGQKQISLRHDDSKVQTNTSFTLRTGDSETLNDQGQDFMSLAFVNTAFAGAEIIDEVEQSVNVRSRSPYEVIRDDGTMNAELSERSASQRTAAESFGMHFISEVEEDIERSQENKFEVKRRPILQHIPSEISEEDLVEREIYSPITRELEEDESLNIQSKVSAVVGSVSGNTSISHDQVQRNGLGGSDSMESGKVISKSYEVSTCSIAEQKTRSGLGDTPDYQSISLNNNNLQSSFQDVISRESIAKVSQLEQKGTEEALPPQTIPKTVVNEQSSIKLSTATKIKPGSSTTNGSPSEFKHRRQVSSLSGQPSDIKGFSFKGTDASSIVLHQMNGPGEVEYRSEYDDEYFAKREVPQEKQTSDMQGFSAAISDQEFDESAEADRLYSMVSDDAVDAEIGNILSLDDQAEDVIARPVTPEPPADETLYESSDFKGDALEIAKRKAAGAAQMEHSFPSRVSRHQFEIADDSELEIVVDRSYEASRKTSSIPVRESEQDFAYGMKFEKGIMGEGEEAMDVDSDQFSEERESAYAYGMRFERDQELDSEEVPCYGDLYTHEEEDEEGFENIEKMKGLPKPDYDILAGKKYFSKNEFDNASESSLQEFEHLEEEIVSGRKSSIGSTDSLNGKTGNSKSGDHDDVSMSSLTEFERLERECLESEKIDPGMQESITQLSEIEEGHESQASEDNRSEEKDDGSIAEDYDGHLDKIDEIILHAQSKVEDSKDKLPFQYLIAHAQKEISDNKMVQGHVKIKSESGMAQRNFEEDDIEQDSLHEDISVKPDSLADDKQEFQDSLHEDKYGDLDSLQGDMPEEMRDSLLEERIIEEDSLHDMDILPDESSFSLESSLAAVDSSREDHVKISIDQTAECDIDVDSLKELKLGGSFTAQITERGAGDMISSTDSLEQSCSGGQPAFQMESESLMTSSLNSAFTSEDCTMISSTDTLEHEGRITYRFEDIPVDEIENIVQTQKVFVDSEGNIQTRVDIQRVMESEGNINGNALTTHSRTEVILPSPSSVRSTVTYTDAQYSGPEGSGYFRDEYESGRDSSHYDPDVEVEEIHTTDEHGNPKTIRKIKRVIRTQKFSSSSSPKNVEEKMKEFLRDHTAGEEAGKGMEEVSEERRIDEKGNVVLLRTVQQQMLTQPQVHSRSFRGPEAEHLSQEFVESFQTLDPTENLYEYVKVDDDGNVVRVTEQVVVRPEVHTITFSGSDAHQQMEDYMQQWQRTQKSAGEFEATKPSFAKEGYYQQLVSSSAHQDFIVPSSESSPQKTSSEVILTGSSTVTTTKIMSSGLKDLSPEKSMMYTTTSISEHQPTEPKESQDKSKE